MKKNLLIGFCLLLSQEALADKNLDYIEVSRLGGETSVYFKGQSVQAYRNPASNLTPEQKELHLSGDVLFERHFSDDPSRKDFGLGPVYNNTNCAGCHNKDGRGALPIVPVSNDWKLLGPSAVFLRISIESNRALDQIVNPEKTLQNHWGAPIPVPGYSDQLFHLGSWGVRDDAPGVGQAKVWMKYEYSSYQYPDGKTVQLRKPVFKITEAISPRIFDADVKFSPRIGTPMIGLGLLEAIPEQDILSLAQKTNPAEEGVSGKANWVFDIEKWNAGNPYPVSLGRFGLKANTPSVHHQSLAALRGDVGVTNYAFPDESIVGTALYESFRVNFPDKIKDGIIDSEKDRADTLVFYSQTLAVPTRRDIDNPDVIRGGELFHQVRCTTCHVPSFTTGQHAIPQLANQKIYPFTDMLLHDMGEGLADDRKDFDADGREWKTRPLWGLGQTKTVNPLAGFLHDGRARTLEEAILWHDGEASFSKRKFSDLSELDRLKLIQFLNSL